MKTIKELAKEALDNFELAKRDNGELYYKLIDYDLSWHKDLAFNVHKGLFSSFMLPNDYIYEAIYESLCIIIDSVGRTEEDIREDVFEANVIQPDVYYNELFAWLSNNSYFLEYVDRAVKDYKYKDMFSSVQIANQLFKEDVFNEVLDYLSDKAKEE